MTNSAEFTLKLRFSLQEHLSEFIIRYCSSGNHRNCSFEKLKAIFLRGGFATPFPRSVATSGIFIYPSFESVAPLDVMKFSRLGKGNFSRGNSKCNLSFNLLRKSFASITSRYVRIFHALSPLLSLGQYKHRKSKADKNLCFCRLVIDGRAFQAPNELPFPGYF